MCTAPGQALHCLTGLADYAGLRGRSASSAYSEEPSGRNISLVASPAHCKCLLPFLFISLVEWKKLPSRL